MKIRLKNPRIAKWLGKYKLFLLRSIAEEWSIRGKATPRRVYDGKAKEQIKWYHSPDEE